ncbi:sulfotransferase domain-containing protein [Winogradskyella sp.]|nr:sulfotransferase domain-containing protein [Winogradskyella sp.]
MNINFYCVGAQKAGTTTLHDILNQHPDIFLPKTKEAHFFDEDEKFEKGLEWYENTFFNESSNEKILGSCNPEYMYFEEVPKRIFESFGGDVKLIFILRNPADRAYSHYLMSKRRCIEELSFTVALKQEKSRINKDYFNKTNFSYASRGFYSEQIKRYLNYFPKENMMFIRFEDDFIKNKNKTINEIISFLDLEQIDLDVDLKSNVARSSRFLFIQKFIYKQNIIKSFFSIFVSQKMKNKIRSWIYKLVMKPEKKNKLSFELKNSLMQQYKEDIKELEGLTGKNFSNWLKTTKY